jgi:hypothetical protein
MYQPSRKILIFLIIIFLAFNIFDGVVAVMTAMHTSGGALNCGCRIIGISLMNTRGTHYLWHLSVLTWLRRHYPTSEFHYLDTCLCVGNPRTVSRSLDGDKTLPWTATTFSRNDNRGLFHDVDQNSHGLLCEVSSYCDYYSLFFHWGVKRDSMADISCFTFIFCVYPTFAIVCQCYLCMRPHFIIYTGPTFSGKSGWFWASSGFADHTNVCARTPPDP